MTARYFHRGLLDGQSDDGVGFDAPTLTTVVEQANGSTTVTYRRTDWFRDGRRMYVPAALVNDDGSLR